MDTDAHALSCSMSPIFFLSKNTEAKTARAARPGRRQQIHRRQPKSAFQPQASHFLPPPRCDRSSKVDAGREQWQINVRGVGTVWAVDPYKIKQALCPVGPNPRQPTCSRCSCAEHKEHSSASKAGEAIALPVPAAVDEAAP
jgi:hypothetical protein